MRQRCEFEHTAAAADQPPGAASQTLSSEAWLAGTLVHAQPAAPPACIPIIGDTLLLLLLLLLWACMVALVQAGAACISEQEVACTAVYARPLERTWSRRACSCTCRASHLTLHSAVAPCRPACTVSSACLFRIQLRLVARMVRAKADEHGVSSYTIHVDKSLGHKR